MSPVSKKRKQGKKKTNSPIILSNYLLNKKNVTYICLQCEVEENIPLGVVQDMDAMDDGDRSVAPRFRCEGCGGEMYPEYYKGIDGTEYDWKS